MRRPRLTALPLGLCLLAALSAPVQASAAAKKGPAAKGAAVIKGVPTVGASLPALALMDVAGRKHSLSELKQPVTLLFFCGCTPCHEFARLWSQVQQGGDLAPPAAPRTPSTVVVFLGGADAARAFAAQTGLDPSQTLLLLDPSDQAAQRFGVIQCPRVFVTDGAHRLIYTNPDDPVPPLSAPALVSRTLTAWRTLTTAKQALPGKKVLP